MRKTQVYKIKRRLWVRETGEYVEPGQETELNLDQLTHELLIESGAIEPKTIFMKEGKVPNGKNRSNKSAGSSDGVSKPDNDNSDS